MKNEKKWKKMKKMKKWKNEKEVCKKQDQTWDIDSRIGPSRALNIIIIRGGRSISQIRETGSQFLREVLRPHKSIRKSPLIKALIS